MVFSISCHQKHSFILYIVQHCLTSIIYGNLNRELTIFLFFKAGPTPGSFTLFPMTLLGPEVGPKYALQHHHPSFTSQATALENSFNEGQTLLTQQCALFCQEVALVCLAMFSLWKSQEAWSD
jgi:hypothetical protein